MKYLGEVYIVFLFVVGKFCSFDVSTRFDRFTGEKERDRDGDRQTDSKREK